MAFAKTFYSQGFQGARLVVGLVCFWGASSAWANFQQSCGLNYALFSELEGESLVRELAEHKVIFGVYRGEAKDLVSLQQKLETLAVEDFEPEKLLEAVSTQMGVRSLQDLSRNVEGLSDLQRRLAGRSHRARRTLSGLEKVPLIGKRIPHRSVEAVDLPRVPSSSEFEEMTRVYEGRSWLDPSMDDYIKQRYFEKETDSVFTKALSSMEELEVGRDIDEDQLKSLLDLEKRYQNFEKTVEHFKKVGRIEGALNRQIYEHLSKHADEIEAELRRLGTTSNERLGLHVPILNADGRASVKVILLESVSHFSQILRRYEREVQQFERLDRELVDHAIEYMQMRHVVEGFRNLMLHKRDTVARAVGEEDFVKLEGLEKFLKNKLTEKDRNTPSLGYLRFARFQMRYSDHPTNLIANNWRAVVLKGVTPLLTLGGVAMYSSRGGDYLKNWRTEKRDRSNLYDYDYWSQRCSTIEEGEISFFNGQRGGEYALEQIRTCLAHFKTLLYQDYLKRVEERTKLNPDQVETIEAQEFRKIYDLWAKVADEVIIQGSRAVQWDVLTGRKLEYTEQGAYAGVTGSFQAQQASSGDRKPSAPGSTSGGAVAPEPVQKQKIQKIVAEASAILTKIPKVWRDQNYVAGLCQRYLAIEVDTSEQLLEKQKSLQKEIDAIKESLNQLSKSQELLRVEQERVKKEMERTKKGEKVGEVTLEDLEALLSSLEVQLGKLQGDTQVLLSQQKGLGAIVLRNEVQKVAPGAPPPAQPAQGSESGAVNP